MNYLLEHHEAGEVVTGLLYLDPNPRDLHAHLNTVRHPLNTLGADELCPGSTVLAALNAEYR